MGTPVIYTSERLRINPKTAHIANSIHTALKEKLHIEHRELKNTNNYWCRDYMPVMVFPDGTYSKFEYKPDYLVEYKTYQKTITNQDEACKELSLFTPTNMGIIFDGGNYVRCGNKVIMTDKIFSENPQWPVHELLQRLRDALCADIVLLPWDMKDFCGHSDGMVAPLEDGRILLNSCWRDKSKSFHRRLLKILEAHFDIVELDYGCKELNDSWCYLNFLKVPNGLLLPCLSENFDCDSDIAAKELFEKLFPGNTIIQIFAQPLIKEGGALHCVTWEYIEKKDVACP
ncbi:hypothetical protein CIK92_09230 [Prevotella sp. P4-67]|uniref:agmatine deiminase family protein n=1 Tax=Prevotella sp. P4-67 TaxID=2024227 RepID=UPI000B96720A|nr:agmatine deiminase family protein [Prevotella sp. P4-67]OYP70656.1 hypothetical protein CIK92_09230 [Prevotella sp. P4-67]